MKKLAIITTHPIQYNAPLFALLNERKHVQVRVFYTWGESVLEKKFDPGFGKDIEWDIPLLNGYEYTFVNNTSANPGSHHYRGIENPSLNKEISEWRADAVMIYGWSLKSHLGAMRYFKGKIPVIFRGDSTLLDEIHPIKRLFRKLFLTWVYKFIDVALFVGQSNKDYYLAHGVSSSKLVYAPHAIDNSRFFNTPTHSEQARVLRSKLNIPEDALVFLFAAKFESKKAPVMLIKAFRKILNSSVRLVLAGNGVLEDEMRKTTSGDERISFLPFQNQSAMPSLYQMADIFILPSLYRETWGLSVNEAMAAGKPVIVSDRVGCAKDIVKHESNGFVFRSGDIESLVNSMNLIIDRSSNLEAMGERSKEIILNHNFTKIAEAIEKIVNES